MSKSTTRFWQQNWFMWVCLFFFAPAGIILVWLRKDFSQKKKIIYSVIGAIWFALVLTLGGGNKTKETSVAVTEPEPSAEVTASPTTTSTATSAAETPEPKESSSATEEPTLSDEDLMTLLNSALSENFENFEMSMDEETRIVSINVWSDGIALGLASYNTNNEVKESWDTMVESLTYMSDQMKKSCDEVGRTDINVNVNLLNDMNRDNVLVSVINGVVFYNAATE